ncbi:uncharacterized protein [Periplaneta americana]|uniref:uncharacterized protein isoform X3 n=1 Tax=Periplaneta americana TaxID=6978 RepID=UPI0037E97C87
MDDIKVKLESDPLAITKNDTNMRHCLSLDRKLMPQHMDEMMVECEDATYEHKPFSVVKCESTSVPFSFAAVKCEPEEESCDVDIVKEEMLDVTEHDHSSARNRAKTSNKIH